MNPKQIDIAKSYLVAIGVDLSKYNVDITTNLSETIALKFTHVTENITITVDDPTNYPNVFTVETGKRCLYGAR